MDRNIKDYHINNPVFVRLKKKFNLLRFSREEFVKSVFINERIIELPYVIQTLAVLPRKSRVLDIGCAESLLPLQLAGLGYQVTGLDVRRYPFSVPGFEFFQADATAMPMPDAVFDAVTCVSMLEHVGLGHYEDPKHEESADGKVVGEIRRVLKAGGIFILTVPFGVSAVDKLQRTYDTSRLTRILFGFCVEEKKFFINERWVRAGLNDVWRECSEAEAAKVRAVEKTACVCLIRMRKA